jgi:hypothetical protein
MLRCPSKGRGVAREEFDFVSFWVQTAKGFRHPLDYKLLFYLAIV